MKYTTSHNPYPNEQVDKVFENTYHVSDDIITKPYVEMKQEAFLLCEADYLRIKRYGSGTFNWIGGIFLTITFTVGIPTGVKLLTDDNAKIAEWEWLTPVICFLIAVGIWIGGHKFHTDHDKVMSDIEDHFSRAPRSYHATERKE